jgi:glycosyltransferase involved in cell wall biosynthesis
LLPHFRACTVVSRREQDLAHQCVPAFEKIEVIPNCINLADYSNIDEAPQLGTLVFTGSFQYRANYEAMLWFLSEVYPRIVAQEPRVCLRITGDHANLPLPKAENVILTGHIPDVRPVIASAWASIVPIWKGGGTRLKILEAMALGTPVVSTTKGAEGLDVQHDEHLLIGDTPQAFADQVVRLVQESGLRERLTDNANRLVRDKYDWSMAMPQFLNLVERVANN